ncbi:hypothetical protein ACFL4P_00970 [Gemmatimonadota bacterium]
MASKHVKSASSPVDRQQASESSNATRPLDDKFVSTSLATGIVYSIKNDQKVTAGAVGVTQSDSGRTSDIVKSGMYSLYKLDGSFRNESPVSRGENLDLRG